VFNWDDSIELVFTGEPESSRSGLYRSCPGCDGQMFDHGCKRRCSRCGYFEDCSNLL